MLSGNAVGAVELRLGATAVAARFRRYRLTILGFSQSQSPLSTTSGMAIQRVNQAA
jgi:hypothetical protein